MSRFSPSPDGGEEEKPFCFVQWFLEANELTIDKSHMYHFRINTETLNNILNRISEANDKCPFRWAVFSERRHELYMYDMLRGFVLFHLYLGC